MVLKPTAPPRPVLASPRADSTSFCTRHRSATILQDAERSQPPAAMPRSASSRLGTSSMPSPNIAARMPVVAVCGSRRPSSQRPVPICRPAASTYNARAGASLSQCLGITLCAFPHRRQPPMVALSAAPTKHARDPATVTVLRARPSRPPGRRHGPDAYTLEDLWLVTVIPFPPVAPHGRRAHSGQRSPAAASTVTIPKSHRVGQANRRVPHRQTARRATAPPTQPVTLSTAR